MIRTVVILVNYNGLKDTEKCVESLLNTSIHPKIVIVDNASREAGIENIEKIHPEITILYSRENLGFGRGNNLGIKWALINTQCEYVFILNNDTIVESNTLPVLEKTMHNHPNIGIVAPKIVMMGNPDILWYGGGDIDWWRGSARIPGYMGPTDSSIALTARKVTFASGCAMLVKRELFESIGGFDKRYFMYVEDVDFSLRALKNGWEIRYVPDSLVHHKGQGSNRIDDGPFVPLLDSKNPKMEFFIYHSVKNRLMNIWDNASTLDSIKFFTVFPVYITVLILRCLLKGKIVAMFKTMSAIRDFSKIRNQRPDMTFLRDKES